MTDELEPLKECPICGSKVEGQINIEIKPEAFLHMLEEIDHLAASGNADGLLCQALIKAGFVEIFDAYSLLFGMGLVHPDNWEVVDGD